MPQGTQSGQTLTVSQLEALWIKAGGSKSTAAVAAAIAMAESSGRSAVTSSNPDGGTNVGPWQLDTKGVGAGHTVAQLQDPLTNAQIAVKGSKNGADWGPWETWVTGAYKQFLGPAQAALNTVEKDVENALKGITGIGGNILGPVGNIVGQVLGLPKQLTDFFSALEKPVKALLWFVNPANWARIMAGVFGFLLLGAGLVALGMAA